MTLSATDNQLAAIYDNTPPVSRQSSAGLMASIWAPRPQHSETTWPKTLDCFSRVVEKDVQHLPLDAKNMAFQQPLVAREVFGPFPQGAQKFPTRDVGAIGDGRKKNSPDYEDSVCAFLLGFLGYLSS
jgi:pumilio RNA-binding family